MYSIPPSAHVGNAPASSFEAMSTTAALPQHCNSLQQSAEHRAGSDLPNCLPRVGTVPTEKSKTTSLCSGIWECAKPKLFSHPRFEAECLHNVRANAGREIILFR